MSDAKVRYGVFGLGSMGRHHVRNIRELDGAELVVLSDPFGDKYSIAGDIPLIKDVNSAIDIGIDAAVVAAPTGSHFEVASKLARAGIHTLVEKPLANTLDEATKLVDLFSEAGLVGAVGYVERCNPALKEMRRLIAEGFLGKIYQISTRRQSPFPARIADVGVVKDLATHDIDLTAWVAGSQYAEISGFTSHRAGRDFEDMVVASGRLANGVIVNHQVNWLTPYKDRTAVVTGENGALVAETVTGDLTYFENGVSEISWEQVRNFRGVSEGTVTRFALNKREPLAVEHEEFLEAIKGESSDFVSMKEALHTMTVVQGILDSADTGKIVSF